MLNTKHNGTLDFVLIGYAYRELVGVKTTGKYSQDTLLDKIEQEKIDLLFFPARWPETYSYTLSYGLCSGLAIFAPNLGAFPERLSNRSNSKLFDHLSTVPKIYSELLNFIEELPQLKDQQKEPKAAVDSVNFYSKRYLT
jgi:hypothetical protein